MDPENWRDSLQTRIYTLLDGLQHDVHSGAPPYPKKHIQILVENCAKAVVKVLENAVKKFQVSIYPLDATQERSGVLLQVIDIDTLCQNTQPPLIPSSNDLRIDLQRMCANAGDRRRRIDSHRASAHCYFTPTFVKVLGNWDERFGLEATSVPAEPAPIVLRDDAPPSTVKSVPDSSQHTCFPYRVANPPEQEDSYAQSLRTEDCRHSFTVPSSSGRALPAASATTLLYPTASESRCAYSASPPWLSELSCRLGQTLIPELEQEVRAMESVMRDYGIAHFFGCHDEHGCCFADGSSSTPEVGQSTAFIDPR